MGLDITHYKLSHSPNDEGNQWTIEDWNSICNVPLEHFSKYITDVWEYDFDKSIAIVKDEQTLEKLKKDKEFSEMDYMAVFVGSQNRKMGIDLATFIKNEKLDKLEQSGFTIESNGIKYSELSFGERVKKKGFYYDEVGYQRQGMNKLFYDTFRTNIFLWGEKKDFDLAYECVGGEYYKDNWSQEALDRLKANFKANFVDKFVFGQSILNTSF
jgi:hypothetical protein